MPLFRRLARAFAFRGQSLPSLSPCFESCWCAVGTPVSLCDGNALTAGAMMRLGLRVLASNNALSSLIGKQARGMDYFIALKVPVPQPKNPETPGEES